MKYYTLLDLSSGYYQITMGKNAKRITTDIINLLECHSSIVFQWQVNVILSNEVHNCNGTVEQYHYPIANYREKENR